MRRQQISFLPALTEKGYTALLQRYAKSVVMHRYLLALKKAAVKPLSLNACVEFIYGPADGAGHRKNLNRFYKLRKKLADDYYSAHVQQPVDRYYTDEEQKREVCRKLIAIGDFFEAEKQLGELQLLCERNNIFELLPDVIEMRIYALQSVNNLHRTAQLYKAHAVAVKLYEQLSAVKRLGRQVYEANLQNGIKAAKPLFKQIDRIARKNAGCPRFKLIYNFLSAYYKIGEGGESISVPNNVIARHLSTLRLSFIRHPVMPVLNYLPGYLAVQKYRLKEMESILQYRMFRFGEAAGLMDSLIEELRQSAGSTRGMLSETMFINAIHLHVAAGNADRALQGVRSYIRFLRENKYLELLPRAYCEMANVYTTLGVKVPVAALQKLLLSVAAYEHLVNRNGAIDDPGAIILLRAKLLWALNRRKDALKLYDTRAVKMHFANDALWQLILDALRLQLTSADDEKARAAMNAKIKKLKFRTEKPSERSTYIWLERLLQ